MKQIKLYRILSSMSPAEYKRFDRFVHSPFFTVHEDTIRFWELISPGYPQFQGEELASETLYAQLCPGKAYDDLYIRTLRKYLLRLAEDFFVQLKVESNDFFRRESLIGMMDQKGFSQDVEQLIAEGKTALSAYPFRDETYFTHQFYLEQLDWQHLVKYGQRTRSPDSTHILLPLDHAYLIQKLGYACPALNQQLQTGVVSTIPLLDALLDYCRTHFDSLPELIKAYYLTVCLLNQSGGNTELEALIQLLHQNGSSFNHTELLNICGYAINYCNFLYRSGESDRLRTMFDIYKFMLAQNLLFEQGLMSLHQFKNLSTLGIRLEEWEWTESFIHTYKNRLDSRYREGVFHYSMAQLAASAKSYRQALRHLQAVEFIDPFYRISYNLLLLKIYYECMEVEALLSLTQTLRTFLRRKKNLSDRQQLAYAHFARFVRILFMERIRPGGKLTAIRIDIEQCEPLIEREWLIKKWEELSSGIHPA